MDIESRTVPELLEWFKTIRKERCELVAKNNDDLNSDLVVESTVAMRGIMKKIVRLVQGTNSATAPPAPICEKESSPVEKAEPSMTTTQEDNKPALADKSDPLRETSPPLPPLREKESPFFGHAGSPMATIPKDNKIAVSQATASTAIPHAPVRSRIVRQQTPLGSFRTIMEPGSNFLEDTLTRLSSMLDWNTRKNLASTSSIMYNLVTRKVKHKAPAAQDQQAAPSKNPKKAKMTTKVARKDRKRSKKALETNNLVGDRAEAATPYQAVKQGEPKAQRKKSGKSLQANSKVDSVSKVVE